jgi:Asp-tRNA(Asn)/Glu-tRNA(Gln) amidotransferase A subunit family amidase
MAPRASAVAADLASLTATEAAQRIAAGDIASEELVGACLARIDELEPQIGAWTFLDREHALAQARAADAARREGKGVSPLQGVPVGIKDIIDTADMPTEHGCPVFKGRRPLEDAACVTALRRAGAVILGKTVTTELAAHNPAGTRNPHNVEHTPGGSSSGSAAAVACGMVPAALGTQTGGSVIRPSAFCGVYGFKPTFGMIPRTGVLTHAHSLDTIGVMGRSVEDVALLADALQAYDEGDPASLTTSRPRLLATATEDWPLAPLFAFVKTHAWRDCDPATHEAFGELVESLGSQVAEVSLDHTTERGCADRAARRGRLPLRPAARSRPAHDQQADDDADRGGPAHVRGRLRGRAQRARDLLGGHRGCPDAPRHNLDARRPRTGAEGARLHRQCRALPVLDVPGRPRRHAASV